MMAPENTHTRPSALFWLICGVLLLWGLVSVAIYVAVLVQTPEEYAAAAEIPAKQQIYADYVANIPWWALTVAIVAALARLFGAIGLLLRKAWAVPLYIAALIFFLVALFRAFVLANAGEAMSTGHIMTQVVFVALSVFAVWFSHWNRSKGILT